MVDDPVVFPPDPADRDREYSPSSRVPSIQPFLERYAAESEACRANVSHRSFRYGPGPRAEVDVFGQSAQRVHLFFHGGYWQQLSKQDASFPAADFVGLGINYIAAGYDLCPEVSLRFIADQAVAATEWVKERFPQAELTVSGSSAGAHLAAWAARSVAVDQLVLLSGIYDLRPLVGTYINDAVGLSDVEAAELSPLRHVDQVRARSTFIFYGANETAAFKAQSENYASALVEAGHPVVVGEIDGRNHFDLVHDLPNLSAAR